MRANLAIVDITNEANPVFAAYPLSYPSSFSGFDVFGSISTASFYTNSVGWFYYSQGNPSGYSDPCSTSYVGQTNTSLGISGTWTTQVIDSGFPTLKLEGADYVGIVKRGLPGGSLFPTWHRAVSTSGAGFGCAYCLGGTRTLAIYGAEVVP